jgi:hypothetical protein
MESIHSDHVFNVTTENIVNEDVIGINDFININESDLRFIYVVVIAIICRNRNWRSKILNRYG